MTKLPKNITQPNRITTARYSYTKIQKDIMIHLIGCLQGKMTMNQTLFKEEIVEIPLKLIDPNKNYNRILKESKAMINKSIAYTFTDKDGKKTTDVLTNLVSTVLHEHGSSYVTYVIPSYALPILCNLSDGYTRFREAIALTLRSSYSKRVYELCCKWEDVGGFRVSIEDFRDQLGIPETYTSGNLKQRILDVAKNELQKDGDLYFEYSIEKKGRKWEYLRFKIIQKNEAKTPELKKALMGEHYNFLWRYMENVFPSKGLKIAEKLSGSNETLTMAYNRFTKLDDEYANGRKKREDIIKISATILKKDFNIVLNQLK